MPGALIITIYTGTHDDAEELEDFVRHLLPPFLSPFEATIERMDSRYRVVVDEEEEGS